MFNFKKSSMIVFSALALLSFVFLNFGCDKKAEEPKQVEQPVVPVPQVDTTKVEEQSVPDLVGTWKGTFDKRACTLKITNQEGLDFEGSITVNYRDVKSQKIKGSFDVEKLTFKMSDQIRNREAGTYSGKFNEDLSVMNGGFSVTADEVKRAISFQLKLQQQ
jgi:PBP1b-binding outer membrane lipoprotein LpoB